VTTAHRQRERSVRTVRDVPDFARFDRRRYRTVGVREGYGTWSQTYDGTVEDAMDLGLLDRLTTVDWVVARVADLGCGTGRTAAWLKRNGVALVDGVDVTPEMLDSARAKGLYAQLVERDVRATGLPAGAYDAVVCSLVDEHLPELTALYAEARRLLRAGGSFVLVGYHPFFIMAAGMPTHFDGADGQPVAVETHIHLFSEHVAAARAAGLFATELHEQLVDDDWLRRKPQWERYADWPISFVWAWAC
jgi:SAM-dependent methyltransferase